MRRHAIAQERQGNWRGGAGFARHHRLPHRLPQSFVGEHVRTEHVLGLVVVRFRQDDRGAPQLLGVRPDRWCQVVVAGDIRRCQFFITTIDPAGIADALQTVEPDFKPDSAHIGPESGTRKIVLIGGQKRVGGHQEHDLTVDPVAEPAGKVIREQFQPDRPGLPLRTVGHQRHANSGYGDKQEDRKWQ
ncbi:hypothetical protein QW131_00805 [Roseibium salinum]|nr:hypothetical protein [Roseibium salinum]